MRAVLEQNKNKAIYLFTTQGHTYVGILRGLLEDVVEMVAPDGVTTILVNLSDVSGIRLYDEDREEVPS
ncbi:MAG: hypothetical protein U0359_39645 [Byssovorax sp.]